MAWVLCSKADVISITPSSEAVLQDFWSDAVESLIRTHLGAPNLGVLLTITREMYDGNDSDMLLLRQPSVVAVTEVIINSGTVPPASYVAFSNGFRLLNQLTFPAGTLNIQVSYTSGNVVDPDSGVATVDPIVRLCAAAMIVAILNYRGRGGSDASVKWGTADAKAGEASPNFSVGLADHLMKIMRRLLRRNSLRIK